MGRRQKYRKVGTQGEVIEKSAERRGTGGRKGGGGGSTKQRGDPSVAYYVGGYGAKRRGAEGRNIITGSVTGSKGALVGN